MQRPVRAFHDGLSDEVPGRHTSSVFGPPPARRRLIGALAAAMVMVAACAGSASPSPSIVASATPTPASATEAATPVTSPNPSTRPTPGPTLASTPIGDRLLATVAVDGAPCALAATSDAIWITSYRTGQLDRVDPATNAVVDRIHVGGTPCGVALGEDGRIWVADLGTGAVLAIDQASMTVTGRIDKLGFNLWDLKAGFGSIWVVDRDMKAVLRVDPKTAAVAASIPIGPQGAGLAVTSDAVWVADSTDGTIRRIDPATNAVAVTAHLDGAPTWFSDDGSGQLVVGRATAGSVTVLDAATGAPGLTVGGWARPLDGTVIGQAAWIPDGPARAVVVVDLATGTVAASYALPDAKNPFVAEPAFGDLWVLDFATTTAWRIRT